MKVWTWVAAAAALIGVGTVAGFGVAAHEQLAALEHAPAYALPTPAPVMVPASPKELMLADAFSNHAQDPRLAEFHARITNAATGQVVFDQLADAPLRPASTTKILTAAAAILELGPRDTVRTDVYRVGDDLVIRAAGDVWLNAEALDDLAAQISSGSAVTGAAAAGAGAATGAAAARVLIDTTAWDGMPELLPGWDPIDIDGGFVAPLQPAMLNGGRGLEEETGDVPRSHTPALDVAQALADRLGIAEVGYGEAPAAGAVGGAPAPASAPAPADAAAPADEPVASIESPDLVSRLEVMMKNSDNVYAEAIGRELALHRGSTDAPGATLAILAEHGFDTSAVTINDNSGLSELNLITPKLLDEILASAAAPGPSDLRPLLATLPVASGDGTLIQRYGDLPGRGWVRAKTGTLDETSALAGIVTSKNGNVYTFAFLSNGSDILSARRALDEFASALREY
ncbi:D-alanyl-D-alanine carboxypeptidase/D-alanyl-D-alanine-endopeptidase [Corynebacterium sp. CNCTC7651]|uniref:D-alanyl-D-alanine carboxypeptidase/D-alanyl-D-alanine endopeptidase n=1 Tax=Corynebacterium sp. CNCTC7651 TaxID=2815361 RepID=UPI001F3472C1|nr:D-alanyl-D-alanine carboxypeptidase/D-alanyl-D-alanine-endopeptidase [Corynebacterium sp. CNCTC7651]UIZ91901.1 D-alanyl-D-alanine carboxypeptidase/D-alanyl-D-alanine-endopeptidase [Corynebacterium sp. CNCTC7651]